MNPTQRQRREDTGKYSRSKLENFTRTKKSTIYRVTSIAALSLSCLSASNSSAHPIAMATPSVLVTQSPLPLDIGLLTPIQPYASCNQMDIFHFLAYTFLAMLINKTPPDAKHLSSNTYTVITHCKTWDSEVHYRNTRYIECIYIIEF